jgi:hypothetical protein
MNPNRKFANPFYALLVLVGIAFVLTATAYGVMAFRTAKAVTTATPQADHPLMDWLDDHGNGLLMLELTLLAIGTCGAISTDDYWKRRAARRR